MVPTDPVPRCPEAWTSFVPRVPGAAIRGSIIAVKDTSERTGSSDPSQLESPAVPKIDPAADR